LKNIHQKYTILGLIALVLILSIAPGQTRLINNESNPQHSLFANDNIVADISVTWDSFLHHYSIKDLAPNVTINQSATRDFYFPEINGTIPQLNFTVICKHKLISPVILPRFTQVYIAVYLNGSYILLSQSPNHRCQSQDWEYINLTVDSSNGFIPLESNGQNITLDIEVGAYFFIFGSIQRLAPVTIHPVPQ
jgi:hypothetical protein